MAHTQSGRARPTDVGADDEDDDDEDACGPGGTWNCRSGGCPRPECDLGTAGRPQLPSRDALAGLSLLLWDELPPLQTGRSPAVHRMQMGASSTTDQSGAVGRCVLMQPPGQNHRWLGRSRSEFARALMPFFLQMRQSKGESLKLQPPTGVRLRPVPNRSCGVYSAILAGRTEAPGMMYPQPPSSCWRLPGVPGGGRPQHTRPAPFLNLQT